MCAFAMRTTSFLLSATASNDVRELFIRIDMNLLYFFLKRTLEVALDPTGSQ